MKKEELEKNEDYVECKTCGHLISKKRAQVVTIEWSNAIPGADNEEKYYCELHTKGYETMRYHNWSPVTYHKNIEVSEDGTPIGYKKLTTKK